MRIVVVLAGAVLMALEILGSRVLAPYFGSSVFVWGSLISTFLVALSAGYAIGGLLADRRPTLGFLGIMIALGAALVLPCVVWAPRILSSIAGAGWDTRWASLFAATVLFLPPSLALGTVTPFAIRIASAGAETAGSVAGGYSALSTAGSIGGTLLTTFFLIPRLSIDLLLLGLAAVLVVCAAMLIQDAASATVTGAAGVACVLALFARGEPASIGGAKVLFRRDTPYHHIAVTQLDDTRWMRFDTLTQGGVSLKHPDRSVVGYDEVLMASFALRPEVRRICIIGLGGGLLPRMISRIRPDAEVDSVEIDPVVRDLALQYFFYRESDHLRTTIDDGRLFLARGGAPYDLIILDAFNSTGVPFHLTTKEFFETLRRRLSPDGMFAANFIGKLMGRDGRLFWSSYLTIRRQFGQVYLVPDVAANPALVSGNVFVFATLSADPVSLSTLEQRATDIATRWNLSTLSRAAKSFVHSPDPPADATELTDGYAPVEALQNF